jgi:hypothetical protein
MPKLIGGGINSSDAAKANQSGAPWQYQPVFQLRS